ncbi:cupin domain-containing protein [Halobellus captivus]|uniref:cupin domain-containing protein n=1 Tax=Halobellus captivus TaxID=2592614 RepID=UPI00119CDADE|nr:cupin domain-containing protein [Halobellus captivus]
MTTIAQLHELDGETHANVFPTSEPKTVRLTLEEGERVDPHRHPGRDIVCYLLDGAIDLELDGETHSLEAGDIARFEGEREISPIARESSTALLVLARRPDQE